MSDAFQSASLGAPDEDYDPYGYYQKARQSLIAEPRRKASPFSPPYLPESDPSPFNPAPLTSMNLQQHSPLETQDVDSRLPTVSNKSSRPNLRDAFASAARAFEPEPEDEEADDGIVPQQDRDTGMASGWNSTSSRRPSNLSSNAEREKVVERGHGHGHEKSAHMALINGHPSTRSRSDNYSPREPNRDEYGQLEIQDVNVGMAHDGMAHDGSRDPYPNHQQEDYSISDPESESLFIPQSDDRPSSRADSRVSHGNGKRAEPPRRYSSDGPKRMAILQRHPARRPSPPPFESTIGSNRRPSRYSGQRNDNWHVNKWREPVDRRLTLELPGRDPINLQKEYQIRRQQYDDDYYHGMQLRDDYMDYDQSYDSRSPPTAGRYSRDHSQAFHPRASDDRPRAPAPAKLRVKTQGRASKVGQASLDKRGLKEGQEEEVLQRGYGVNDPENVEIVNMKETGDFSFEDIARILNDKRLDEGRDPKLTTTGVNGRYNRTAPTLFESQGLHFVSLIERKRNPAAARMHGKPVGEIDGEPQDLWDANEHDRILVDAVREYNSEKWTIVAQKVAEKTGLHFLENQLAKRFVLL